MKNNYKINRILLKVFIVLLNQLHLSAQKINDEIEQNLKNIFFNLNIDSCQNRILKEIDSNETYQFISRKNILFPCFKLKDNKQSIIECDSTLIQLQPSYARRSVSHGKIDYERLYGHRVSIIIYFHDSTLATNTYKQLIDSISRKLNRTYSSGDITSKKNVVGNSSVINIDKKNNGYEYERNLSISIRNYDQLFVVSIEFEKLTITQEICEE